MGGLMEKAASKLDLPLDIAAGLPRLELMGSSELLMENHRGILEYGPRRVAINGGKLIVSVSGEELSIKSMNQREIRLAGRIDSVEFKR